MNRTSAFSLTAAVTLVLAVVPPARAQQGTIIGRVTAQSTGEPLPARVAIAGSALGALANADGRYRVSGVPPG
ncbi:MAG TPA: hypothetical protein VEO73_08110, partial [Gemmatimonadales bacterium]|nr:hypothetical protein [Gemmatimonadales bacterium]